MRLCANLSWLFGEVPFLDRFAAAARAGFTGVEILSPYEHPVADLRGRLRDWGLQLVLVNSPMGDRAGERGLACLPGREEAFRTSIRIALDTALALDCGMIHVMAGLRPADVPEEVAAALYAVNLAWAADQAAGTGVELVIEAINQRDMPGYHLRTQEQAAAMVTALRPRPVGLQFDLYHCQTAQGDVARRIEALFPLIRHIQVADVPDRTEPGTGEIGWEYLFRHLRRLGYQGWIGCEYRPAGATEAGLRWRERLLGGDPDGWSEPP